MTDDRFAPTKNSKTTDRPDRLVTLNDAALDLPRVIEGACGHYHGVPLEANPWPRSYPQYWQAWRHGWVSAAIYRDYHGANESERYLAEPVDVGGSS